MSNIVEFHPKNQQDWRKWLEKNHQTEDAVWLIFYKQSSTKANLTWSEAVDHSLCYGWIDSIKKTVDSESYKQYFSKRKANSTWSKVNKDKVEKLAADNVMKDAGFKVIDVAKKNGSWTLLDSVEALILPDLLLQEFKKHEGALAYYKGLSNSDKKILLSWIALAKRPDTKEKRAIEIAENAAQNQKPKVFRN